MRADDDILYMLIVKGGGKWTWDKNARLKTDRPNEGALRRLAAQGFVQVETRSCSPWSFGPSYPKPIWRPTGAQGAEWDQALKDYKSFQTKYPRTLLMRSEIYAEVTDMGIRFAVDTGVLS